MEQEVPTVEPKIIKQNVGEEKLKELVIEEDPNIYYLEWQLIGTGSFGKVYSVIEKTTNEKVAIKQIELNDSNNDFSDEINEIQLMKKLQHPNIVTYHRSFRFGETLSIVMSYEPNGTLRKWILAKQFTANEIAVIMKEIVTGLAFIHSQNIVHRDLKSNNVLIGENRIKIADFGLSLDLNVDDAVDECKGLQAPECFNEEKIDCKADVWSIGLMLMEFLEKKSYINYYPFLYFEQIVNFKLPKLAKKGHITPELQNFLLNCLKEDRNERMSSQQLLEHDFVANCGSLQIFFDAIEPDIETNFATKKLKTE